MLWCARVGQRAWASSAMASGEEVFSCYLNDAQLRMSHGARAEALAQYLFECDCPQCKAEEGEGASDEEAPEGEEEEGGGAGAEDE